MNALLARRLITSERGQGEKRGFSASFLFGKPQKQNIASELLFQCRLIERFGRGNESQIFRASLPRLDFLLNVGLRQYYFVLLRFSFFLLGSDYHGANTRSLT